MNTIADRLPHHHYHTMVVETLGAIRFETVSILTNTDNVELETTLQELLLNLRGDAVETDMTLGVNSVGRRRGHLE